MFQIAVFVDAGYLYAQGSTAISGSKRKRHEIRLDPALALADLRSLAEVAAPGARLLRIYWYDGLSRGGRLNSEQSALAITRDVKLRLGMINGLGQQKGVDSLIVTDLIDLARNRAVTDALIMSGDEDIRVGVQVAQTFGVRVHLLGLEPARGSQSPDLIQEADTTYEWSRDHIGRWMSFGDEAALSEEPEAPRYETRDAPSITQEVFEEVLGSLSLKEISAACAFLRANRDQIPPDYDRPMLGKLKARIGRELTSAERSEHRRQVAEMLRAKENSVVE